MRELKARREGGEGAVEESGVLREAALGLFAICGGGGGGGEVGLVQGRFLVFVGAKSLILLWIHGWWLVVI